MGFLTTITLHNDYLHDMRANPERFARELFEAIDRANYERSPHYSGGITVQPSRHADDHAVFVHYGNTVLDITGKRMERAATELPDVARSYVKTAQSIVTYAKQKFLKKS